MRAGLALSIYLELHVKVTSKASSDKPLNCSVTYENPEGTADDISLDPETNLITRVALYVLRCHEQHAFPVETHVHIINPVPLGRGLGSSGTAVVAGVMLANEVGKLGLKKERLLDYCLMIGLSHKLPLALVIFTPVIRLSKFLYFQFICLTISIIYGAIYLFLVLCLERHPDNVAASLFGGFVGTYLNELDPEDIARIEIPLSEVLPAPAGGIDTGKKPPEPPVGIGHYKRFHWAKEIKAIAIIPDFEVPTANARDVLPKTYTRADVVGFFFPFCECVCLHLKPS